jgi:hypothetical protein
MNVLLVPVAGVHACLYRKIALALRELGHRADLLPVFPRARHYLETEREPHLDFERRFRELYRKETSCTDEDLGRLAGFEMAIGGCVKRRLEKAVSAARGFWKKVLSEVNYDRVVINNGAGFLCQSLVEAVRAEGRGFVLYTEAGFFPDTLVMDPMGVNCNSILMKLRMEELPPPNPVTEKFLASFRDGGMQPRPGTCNLETLSSHVHSLSMLRKEFAVINGRTSLWVAKNFLFPKLVRRTKNGDPKTRDLGRYLFVPLQVHDDTQVLVNSPTIREMASLVRCVAGYLPKDLRLVIKPHPLDKGRARLYEVRKTMRSLGSRGSLVEHTSSRELVRNAVSVCTLNSTVGLEALLHGKPTVCLGRSWYARPGLATFIAKPEDLETWLNKPVPPDPGLLRKLVSFLAFHYLLPGSFQSATENEALGMARRVLGDSLPFMS